MRRSLARLLPMVFPLVLVMVGLAPHVAAQAALRTRSSTVRPFYLDSSYDRFSDTQDITLGSQTLVSTKGLHFTFGEGCVPGGPCSDLFVRLIYIEPKTRDAAAKAVLRALRDDTWCLEMIFHEPDGDARDSECFTHLGTAPTETGRQVAVGLDLDADLYAPRFRVATSIEMRLMGTTITDSLSHRDLQKLDPFWAEIDRRQTLHPRS